MSNQTVLTPGYRSYKSLGLSVHKFGGSSLQTKEQLIKLANFINYQTNSGDLIVVSANGKVTDWLVNFQQGQKGALNKINNYLCDLADALLGQASEFKHNLKKDLNVIEKGYPEFNICQHRLLSYGELWSVRLLETYCIENNISLQALSPELFLRIEETDGVDVFSDSYSNQFFMRLFSNHQNQRYLIPGFIAQDIQGNLITLGRNGSDYSATAISKLINAKTVTIWTDVDGIYTADPNIVHNAVRLDELSFCEAQALSELGANVLHQKTVTPLLGSDIKAYIKSSNLEGSIGTRVSKDISQEQEVKTITIKNELKRLVINDISEISAKNIQKQLLIKQIATYANSYDKSLCRLTLYVAIDDVFSCTSIIKSFDHQVLVADGCSALISLVGQNIRQNTKLIGKFLSQLDRYAIQHIHYPGNYHTLCVFVDDSIANTILRDLHNSFFSKEESVPLVVLGYGNIGKQFVSILKQRKASIESALNKKLSLKAIANSQSYILSDSCLMDHEDISLNLKNNSNGELFQALDSYRHKEIVIIDLTASNEVSKKYLEFASNGWHIISANKIAASDSKYAKEIKDEVNKNHRLWLTNTTAGAGLPVQTAIQKIQESGDEVAEISGIFSGSLSWLFGQYDGSQDFSKLLRVAKDNAFTEPDPREDLSGNDVIRKMKILASEVGFDNFIEDFSPALSTEFFKGDQEQFWKNSENINTYVSNLYKQASEKDCVLRYVATLNKRKLKLSLEFIEKDHPFANLNPCDNIFSIKSKWYSDNPLIIQGPGAGREVTAAGVLNDLCDLLRKS